METPRDSTIARNVVYPASRALKPGKTINVCFYDQPPFAFLRENQKSIYSLLILDFLPLISPQFVSHF